MELADTPEQYGFHQLMSTYVIIRYFIINPHSEVITTNLHAFAKSLNLYAALKNAQSLYDNNLAYMIRYPFQEPPVEQEYIDTIISSLAGMLGE